jgi:hypothetical protein
MNTNYYSEIFSEVLVFKTNISTTIQLEKVRPILSMLQGIKNWSIDREDVDKVLRIESEHLLPEVIICLLKDAGFECEELPD